MSEEKLSQQLHENVAFDYEIFINEVYEEMPEDIVGVAYEIAIRKIIKDILMNKKLCEEKLVTLLKCDSLFDECYDEWISMENELDTIIEKAIDKRIELIIKEKDLYN